MPLPTAHMPSDADLGGTVVVVTSYTCTVMHPSLLSCLMGTYIHRVLLFAWILLIKK